MCDDLPISADAVELYDSVPSAPLASPGAAGGQCDRRMFLQTAAAACFCVAVSRCLHGEPPFAAAPDSEEWRYVREARFYQKLPERAVQCKLCPRECVVAEGDRGYCRVRENRKGTYYTLVHSRAVAAHVDPIEKKPFFHFLPGVMAFSIATGGCNVNCKFCQNWEISQARPEQLRALYLPPRELARQARRNQCPVLAYTYSEPVVFTEYVLDAAEAGHAAGLRSVVVSNGFIQQEPLRHLCQRVDAIKIDLKSFSEKYYREVVRGELRPVLETLVTVRRRAKWMEIVYLVVPTLNDREAEFRDLARWIKANLGSDVPIHFTRFYPKYLLANLPPTPVETLERAKAIAEAEGLQYTYVGNVPGHAGANTFCPKCRSLLIERAGFTTSPRNLKNGRCKRCGQAVPGVWKA